MPVGWQGSRSPGVGERSEPTPPVQGLEYAKAASVADASAAVAARQRREGELKTKLGKKHFRQIQGATHGILEKHCGGLLAQEGRSARRCFQWVRWVMSAG